GPRRHRSTDGHHRDESKHDHARAGGARGGGRPGPSRACSRAGWRATAARKKTPRLTAALRRVMEPATAGDPTSDVKWTRKSTRRIAKVLTDRRTPISHSSVHRKLKSGGYSLRSNRKRLSIRQSPDRDRQF